MEAIKTTFATGALATAVNVAGNLAGRMVTNQYPLSGAMVAGATFGVCGGVGELTKSFGSQFADVKIYVFVLAALGTAVFTPHIAKKLTHHSMSYYQSAAYGAFLPIVLIVATLCKGQQ